MGTADGKYTITAKLSGGSGRAEITEPSEVTVNGEKIQAEIIWKSPYYDYMEAEGKEYYPISNDNQTSVFVIDISRFDCEIPVKAETTAMSQPHLIEYTLYFDSSTLEKVSTFPTELCVAECGLLVLLSAVICIFKKRKEKSYEKKN